MKKICITLALFLLLGLAVQAQAHSVGLNWTASSTSGVAGYNIYRAPCTGTITAGTCSAVGTFAKIGSVNAPTITYTDSTPIGGSLYVYGVTAFCGATGCVGADPNSESVKSNLVAVTIPLTPPAPPTGLTLGTVAFNQTGANTTLTASWMDSPGIQTWYTFTANGRVVLQGYEANQTGSYTVSWAGKLSPHSSASFQVCDADGICESRKL